MTKRKLGPASGVCCCGRQRHYQQFHLGKGLQTCPVTPASSDQASPLCFQHTRRLEEDPHHRFKTPQLAEASLKGHPCQVDFFKTSCRTDCRKRCFCVTGVLRTGTLKTLIVLWGCRKNWKITESATALLNVLPDNRQLLAAARNLRGRTLR